MLPSYGDGTTKKGKGVKKAKKKMSLVQCCILLLLLIWVVGVAAYFYRHLERERGPEAGGLVGLVLLGPRSAYGRAWRQQCEAFLAAVERRFPIPGWSEESVKDIGRYREGEYLDQILEREHEIAREATRRRESLDPLAKARPIGAVAGEMGGVLEDEPFLPPHAGLSHDLPPGSYRGSCDGCQLLSRQLICARCKDGRGQEHETKIRIDSCRETEWIGNMNGRLTCEPKPQAAVAGSSELKEKHGDAEEVPAAEPVAAKDVRTESADGTAEKAHQPPLPDKDLHLEEHIKLRDAAANDDAAAAEAGIPPQKAARKMWPARPMDCRWEPSKVRSLVVRLSSLLDHGATSLDVRVCPAGRDPDNGPGSG